MQAIRLENPYLALGLATNYLSAKPIFANLTFSEIIALLNGQIERNHYFFVEDKGELVGFLGYAVTIEEKADAWLKDATLSSKDSLVGDCLILNMWVADKPAVNKLIQEKLNTLRPDIKFLYFKRYYKNGNIRSVKLKV